MDSKLAATIGACVHVNFRNTTMASPDDIELPSNEYPRVDSLAEAQALSGYVLVMEGDYGGQIYATCPVDLVRCGAGDLEKLLVYLDRLQWGEPLGRSIYFEFAPAGSHLDGGMGGGTVVPGVWCHEELHAMGIAALVADLIEGRGRRPAFPSLEHFEQLGHSGDAKTQYLLSCWFRRSDPEKALQWLEKAGAQDHLIAMSDLSCNRMISREKQIVWMTKIAARSDSHEIIDWARFRLAHSFENGDGIERDLAAAAELYKQCCKRRYSSRCARRLGEMYFYGHGVGQDLRLSVMWLTLGCVSERDQPPHWDGGASPEELASAKALLDEVKIVAGPESVAVAEDMALKFVAGELEF